MNGRDLLTLDLVGLFGVELEQRLELEKSIIPSIVTRCIQEVELRGKSHLLLLPPVPLSDGA